MKCLIVCHANLPVIVYYQLVILQVKKFCGDNIEKDAVGVEIESTGNYHLSDIKNYSFNKNKTLLAAKLKKLHLR